MADTNTTGRQDGTRKMSKLIENMAQAIECTWPEKESWMETFNCSPLAKAALAVVLASLREPSEGMTKEGWGETEYEPERNLRAVWQAMLSQWAKEQGIE